MSGAAFGGFPEVTFAFLRGIAAHNEKAWLDAHRDDYRMGYVEPTLAFIAALAPRLKKISRTVKAEARINGSLFRIQRDVRFSGDKSPYKTHLDLWFWEGERRGWDSPGFFFRMFPERLLLGAGMHGFGKPQLAAYRSAVLDGRKGRALEAALAEVRAAGGYEIGGATRKKVPRGFDPEHPRAALLLHEGLWAGLEEPVPPEARTAAFVEHTAAHFAALYPVSRWLKSALAT